SDAYLRATETDRSQIVGRNLSELFPDDAATSDDPEAAALVASLQRVLARGVPDTMPVRRHDLRRSGDRRLLDEGARGTIEERHWSRSNAPVLASDGRVASIIHSVADVTRMVELEESVAALRRACEKAEHASQLKTRFLGMVSHELRTPLT